MRKRWKHTLSKMVILMMTIAPKKTTAINVTNDAGVSVVSYSPIRRPCCIFDTTGHRGYTILYEMYESTMNTIEYESRVFTNILGINRHYLDERQKYKLFKAYSVISFGSLVSCSQKLVSRKLVNSNHDMVHGNVVSHGGIDYIMTIHNTFG